MDRVVLFVLGAVLLAGCTGGGTKAEVQEVFDAYCENMMAEDAEGIVDLTTAKEGSTTYTRSVQALSFVFSRYEVDLCTVTVEAVTMEGATATATITENYSFSVTGDGQDGLVGPPRSGTREVTLKRVDGDWFIAPQEAQR